MRWTYASVVLLLVSGCVSAGSVKDARHVRTTPIAGVSQLVFDGPANLHLVQAAAAHEVRVEGEADAMDSVHLRQQGNQLVIHSTRPGVDIFVPAENIDDVRFGSPQHNIVSGRECTVSVSGNARAQLDSIVADTVTINVDGEGRVSVGDMKAAQVASHMDAYGSIRAVNLSYLSE